MTSDVDGARLPFLARPARRALEAAGIDSLAAAATWTESDVAALHGMGPRAVAALREALTDAGLAFRASR